MQIPYCCNRSDQIAGVLAAPRAQIKDKGHPDLAVLTPDWSSEPPADNVDLRLTAHLIAYIYAIGGQIYESDDDLHIEGVEFFFEEKFTDIFLEWMTRFSEFDRIEELSVAGCALSDRGVEFLAHFPLLSRLILSRTKIKDTDCAPLSGLQHLDTVYLDYTGIGDRAAAHLARIPLLRYLNLKSTKITDAGIAAFTNAGNLDELVLDGSNISDAAVPALSAIPKLGLVSLWETRMSESGVDTLRCLCPDLLVEWGPPRAAEPIE